MPVGRPYPEAVTVAGLVWPPNEDLKIGLQSFLSFYTFLNNYLSVCPIFSIFFLFLIRHQRHNIQEWMQSLKKQIQIIHVWCLTVFSVCVPHPHVGNSPKFSSFFHRNRIMLWKQTDKLAEKDNNQKVREICSPCVNSVHTYSWKKLRKIHVPLIGGINYATMLSN